MVTSRALFKSEYTSVSKLILFSIIICMILISSACGKPKPGEIVECSPVELQEMFEDEETFAVQFVKNGCQYCEELQADEQEILKEHGYLINYVVINPENFDLISEMIEEYELPELQTVPMLVWIKKGEYSNQFPIVSRMEQKRILELWLDDNYKGGQ